jgi:hypothetical protein
MPLSSLSSTSAPRTVTALRWLTSQPDAVHNTCTLMPRPPDEPSGSVARTEVASIEAPEPMMRMPASCAPSTKLPAILTDVVPSVLSTSMPRQAVS